MIGSQKAFFVVLDYAFVVLLITGTLWVIAMASILILSSFFNLTPSDLGLAQAHTVSHGQRLVLECTTK